MRHNKMMKLSQKKTAIKASVDKPDAYHHGDLKATLIHTAVKMLEKVTPEQLSLRELARNAGVSQAAPYRHFKNKDELLAAINQQGFELKFKIIKDTVEAHRDHPRELYIQCGLAYFRMGQKHPQHFKLMMNGVNHCPSPKYPELMMAASATFALIRDVMIFCQRHKVIGVGNPYHQALNCWSVVNGFTSLYVENRFGWLGMTPENSEAALRILLLQHLEGAKNGLSADKNTFTPFIEADSPTHLDILQKIEIFK